ncbi:MAG TPA: DUF6531 domain-containing protein, partial [Chthonomonadaceae bacterium]|nr:DUF6531 domain-containing protein [Chthonomonadaceae bacterium]
MTSHSFAPRWIQRTARLCLVSFTWTFVLATPTHLLANPIPKTFAPARPFAVPASAIKHKLIPPPASLKHNLKPLAPAQLARLQARASAHPHPSATLLDEVGRLNGTVLDSQVSAWRQRLAKPGQSPTAQAKLRLAIGEAELAKYEQPEQAIAQFDQTRRLAGPRSPLAGQARYDSAVALFYEGAYRPAEEAFGALLRDPHPAPGLDRRQAARWLRHATACAGYHARRERAGIREPQRLDPLCGAEAIAVALRAMKRPYDRSTVLANVRVTGEGSNMQDLVNAGRKLGLAPHVVAAGDKGLKLLPMPLVAAVEHDHFVAIYKVNAQGVTYLCSDCGAWPGGERTVTWKQWRLMEAGPFLTLSLPGSVEDRALARLEAKRGAQDRQAAVIDGRGNDVNVFARGPSAECPSGAQAGRSAAHDRYSGAPGAHVALAGYQGLSDVAQVARLAESLKAAAVRQYAAPAVLTTCGAKPTGQACCPQPCPTDGGPTTSGPIGQPKTLADGGPSKGDPVNLATGEEEYQPDADLTVYNPIGPSVSISRIYNSLRPMDQTYESDDFGVGWSHPYNITVYDPTVNVNYRLQQGGSTSVTATGTDLPGSGLTWDIVLNGSTVASSSSAGSWSVSNSFGSTSISISVPSGATIATSYEVRYSNHGFGSGKSAKFDVVSSSSVPQVPQGASAMAISGSGSDSPGTGLTWDVVQSTTTIASSSAPNGWAASYPGYITCPNLATPGSYELRTHFSGHGIVSFNFQVYAVNYIPKTGTRYLIEPNGARVPITASSVPTSGSPTVVCTVAAGYPYYVEWKYSSGNTSGYYVITGADRTKMTTTTAAKAIGWTTGGGGVPITTTTSAILMVVSQITDNNGNSINLLYGGSGPSGFPLLTSITDSGSSALITITHDSTTGGITEIDDRYSRSVYYSVGSYATTNVPGGYPQYFMEVDHVSQIVATGTSSPPDRYAYGYQSVSNGEGSEEVPFLHTITVPSPTGTGTATATINYATDGTCVVTSIVDANGNQAVYTPVTSVASTQVTYKDSGGTTIYQYTADFDSNMSEVQRTNGSGVYQATNTFSDPNDPYRPSNITNAVSVSTDYTWDQFGNTLTRTSARGTVTTFTVDYTNFPLGELTQIVEGSKTATSLIYYEPSGLIHTLVTPKPGTAGSSQTVTSTWTYDSLGNVLTETGPGNSSTVTSITNTFNYTTDGTYSQSAAIRQPLTKTDNLGHVTHMRYDARANLTGVLDAVGNETDLSYNLANQNTTITFAATGSTGTGHATFNNVYLYAGGPKTEETQKNESATQVFDIVYTLGAEGEELGRSGSTQPYTATLDALYRPVSVSDGNSHATQMYYNSAGYAWKTVYPNGDTFEYTSFNDIGQPTQRVDGRSVTTNYTYSDAESKLSAVAYPACTSINVSLHYDSYGRMDTMSDGSGSHAYSYDDRDGRLTDQTTYTGLSAMTLTTAYNDDGSRASLILPDTTSFSYSYDAAARLTG